LLAMACWQPWITSTWLTSLSFRQVGNRLIWSEDLGQLLLTWTYWSTLTNMIDVEVQVLFVVLLQLTVLELLSKRWINHWTLFRNRFDSFKVKSYFTLIFIILFV
jgi:hypothetical protein